ncbi:unnamed protein product [Ilex paraguariensis]|uniref:Uncharacterized protein n=1 Tax=Ilex paraguariensis TaxID=185542 RepID=A0ABC8RUJ6_9AQUA
MSCWLDTDDELEIIDSTSVEMDLLMRKKPEEQGERKMSSWVVEVDDKLEMMGNASSSSSPKKQSIYRVPTFIADPNKKVYSPHAVSFGPYHHDEVRLKPMESHKERSLLHFLQRTKVPLKTIFDSFAQVEQELKDSYDSLDSKWQTDNEGFLKLMIVDGCFMLKIFQAVTKTPADYDADDLIFGNHGKLYIMPASFPLKLKDILDSFAQVEEELKDSYDSLDPKWQSDSSDKEGFLNVMIIDGCFMLEIFRAAIKTPDDYHSDDPIFGNHGELNIMPFIKRDMLMLENQLPMLVLDKLLAISKNGDESINELIHKFCNPDSRDIPPPTGKCLHVLDMFRKSLFMKPSVTISMTGMGIGTVTGTGTDTGTVTRIAFEHCHVGAGLEVTSYIRFVDNLIDTSSDVSFLQSKRIVQNFIGSDKGAANLFNTSSKNLTIDPASKLGWWRANLIHTYFPNPWTLISVVAAGVLFDLTKAQTAYGTLQYYQG